MSTSYFASDGSFGDAAGMVLIDTSKWTDKEWEDIERVSDARRVQAAQDIAAYVARRDES